MDQLHRHFIYTGKLIDDSTAITAVMSGNDTITKRCLSEERGDLMPIVISLAAVIGVLMALLALTFIYTLQNKYVVLFGMLVDIPTMQICTGISRNTHNHICYH